MAKAPPIIQDGILTDLRDRFPVQIVVDSSDWYAWLQTASIFTFRGEHGSFTAHKEHAGNRRGHAYWRAYRTWQGKLHRAYLGQSEGITLERLQSVAVMLANKGEGDHSLDVPGLKEETRPSSEASSRARTHRRQATAAPGPHEADRAHPWLASLPVPLTTLIGREQEVHAIGELFSHPEVRLLTITGTGGVGKTRLALEVARVVRTDFADGACFVPLATVSDPSRVMAAIAQVLGLWEVADLSPEEQVQAALRERHLLLLLDNFEQVAQAAPQLVSLLASCPRPRILVTSRAALHLSGEYEFPVTPLALPDLTKIPSPEELSQLASVHLFLLRTQAIQPAFHMTAANARAIAEICVQLDGLPLAIELAAARSKLLPPQALLVRLTHRLLVLTGGAQDLPARQQTLRNTLQWSYDLLTVEEQRLFRWLSIFVGGCTLEAAEAVCQAGQSGDQASSVLEGVASLLDKSLVQQTEQEGGEPRLVILETIREFGLDCLERQGELEAARQAHARYYLTLVEAAEPHLFGPEQLRWFDRLEQELDNLRAIIQAAMVGEEETELGLRIGSSLQFFWQGRGYLREGRNMLERLLAGVQEIAAPVRLKALVTIGMILWIQSDARGLEQVADEALVFAREQDDQLNISYALALRGTAIMLDRRDYAAAQACLEEALTEAHTLGDRLLLVWTLLSQGRMALYQREYSRAMVCFEEGVALCRARGDKVLMCVFLFQLARAELSLGHAVHARTLLEESLTISRECGNPWAIALVLSTLGWLAVQQGEIIHAEAFLTEGASLASEVGDRRTVARSRLLLAGLATLRGEYAAARQWYEEGLATVLDIEHVNYIASGLKGLGCVAAALGLPTWAALLWGTAEPLRESRSVAISQELYERMVAVVRSQLGEPAFKEARARGRTMTPAQALASPEAFAPQVTQQAQAASGFASTALKRHPSYPAGLTAREIEVLRLVAQGLSDAQVAEQLVISPRTVNWHLTSIYSKLGVSSRAAATRYAIEQHLM
jgi:predicted ATPase/DNA-binding CsgD family transcriptional regulator